MKFYYIARFTGEHAKVPIGYEIRFYSDYRVPHDNIGKVNSNRFYNEIAQQAQAQHMDVDLGVTINVIKGLAKGGHFSIECPALEAEYAKHDALKAQHENKREEAKEKDTPKKEDGRQPRSTPSPHQSHSESSGSNASSHNFIGGIFIALWRIIRWTFFSRWISQKGASVTSILGYIIKTMVRLCVIVLILVPCFIISAIIKENGHS